MSGRECERCAFIGPDEVPTDGTFTVRTTPYASSTRPWWADPEEAPDD